MLMQSLKLKNVYTTLGMQNIHLIDRHWNIKIFPKCDLNI